MVSVQQELKKGPVWVVWLRVFFMVVVKMRDPELELNARCWSSQGWQSLSISLFPIPLLPRPL